MHLIFYYFVVDDLPDNYDDVVIVRQFSNDKTGVGFELHPSRLEYFYLVFLQIIVANKVCRLFVHVINNTHVYIRGCSGV